jgi:hypothetical protein
MTFIKQLNQFCEQEEPEDALDFVYVTIDNLFRDDRFQDVDRILSCIELDKINHHVVMLGLVSITRAGKNKISVRDDFIDDVRKKMLETRSEEEVNSLLKGIE